jgi:hypothetical protein
MDRRWLRVAQPQGRAGLGFQRSERRQVHSRSATTG